MSGISAPRGTKDILPVKWKNGSTWRTSSGASARDTGYRERSVPPLFEHTELFQRGIGEATDLIEKEMYTFTDRGGRQHGTLFAA